MQLYIVQFKKYQGIILIFWSMWTTANCKVIIVMRSLGFFFHRDKKKAIFISKNSSPQQGDIKQFNHDNCTVKNFWIFLHI